MALKLLKGEGKKPKEEQKPVSPLAIARLERKLGCKKGELAKNPKRLGKLLESLEPVEEMAVRMKDGITITKDSELRIKETPPWTVKEGATAARLRLMELRALKALSEKTGKPKGESESDAK